MSTDYGEGVCPSCGEPLPTATLEGIERLRKDIRKATELGRDEARFLVDAYYTTQENRIRASHQARSLAQGEEPNAVVAWLLDQQWTLEREIRQVLDDFSSRSNPGVWAKSVCGIGPVIAAGLLCHIDIEQAPTVGHIWRFAGLDPTVEWKKKERRPWNADLKRLCWLIGESFVKVSGRESDVYGKVYLARKEQEVAKNEAGMFADQAAQALATKKWRDDTQAKAHYDAGKLPPGRIHSRAKRYATKLFLSHLHHTMYEDHFGTPPPKPYVVTHLGHAHYIPPPGWPL